MSYSNFLIHRIEVSRLQTVSGFKQVYQVVEKTLPCNIQPVIAEYASVTGMVYGRTYNCFLKLGADIQIGDRVIDEDNKEYRVTGSLKRNYGNSAPHLTVVLTEQSAAGNDQ